MPHWNPGTGYANVGLGVHDPSKRKIAPTHPCKICGAVAWYKGGREYFCGNHRVEAVEAAKRMIRL